MLFETHHPEGCDWPIKMQQQPGPSKTWQEEREAKGEQGPARTTRKQPSQTSQEWWALVWMKDEKIQPCRHWNANKCIIKLYMYTNLNMTSYPGIYICIIMLINPTYKIEYSSKDCNLCSFSSMEEKNTHAIHLFHEWKQHSIMYLIQSTHS